MSRSGRTCSSPAPATTATRTATPRRKTATIDDKLINPGAYDFPGDGVDNDCDGTIDNPMIACETVPSENPGTPTDFARAADVCAQPRYDPLITAAWGQVQRLRPWPAPLDLARRRRSK